MKTKSDLSGCAATLSAWRWQKKSSKAAESGSGSSASGSLAADRSARARAIRKSIESSARGRPRTAETEPEKPDATPLFGVDAPLERPAAAWRRAPIGTVVYSRRPESDGATGVIVSQGDDGPKILAAASSSDRSKMGGIEPWFTRSRLISPTPGDTAATLAMMLNPSEDGTRLEVRAPADALDWIARLSQAQIDTSIYRAIEYRARRLGLNVAAGASFQLDRGAGVAWVPLVMAAAPSVGRTKARTAKTKPKREDFPSGSAGDAAFAVVSRFWDAASTKGLDPTFSSKYKKGDEKHPFALLGVEQPAVMSHAEWISSGSFLAVREKGGQVETIWLPGSKSFFLTGTIDKGAKAAERNLSRAQSYMAIIAYGSSNLAKAIARQLRDGIGRRTGSNQGDLDGTAMGFESSNGVRVFVFPPFSQDVVRVDFSSNGSTETVLVPGTEAVEIAKGLRETPSMPTLLRLGAGSKAASDAPSFVEPPAPPGYSFSEPWPPEITAALSQIDQRKNTAPGESYTATEELASLVREAAVFASRDETREWLAGVLIVRNSTRTIVASTDGHRAYVVTIEREIDSATAPFSAFVPIKRAEKFKKGDSLFRGLARSEKFPPFGQVFSSALFGGKTGDPASGGFWFYAPAELPELVASATRAAKTRAKLAGETYDKHRNGIRFQPLGDAFGVVARWDELLTFKTQGDLKIVIGLNGKYLAEAVEAFAVKIKKTKSQDGYAVGVRVKGLGELDPVVMGGKTGINARAMVLMPMRV